MTTVFDGRSMMPPRSTPHEVAKIVHAVVELGKGREDRARWLSRFANSDIAAIAPADADALRWEVLLFGRDLARGHEDPGKILEVFTHARQRARKDASAGADDFGWARLYRADPREGLRQLHNWVRSCLADLFEKQRVWVPFGVVEGVRRLPDGRVVLASRGRPERAFFKAVFELLVALGPRLRVCGRPECGKVFVGVRRQAYCAGACSQRVRTERFYKLHPRLVADRKHAAYEIRRRTKLGPRVKVARRPRVRDGRAHEHRGT